MNITDFTKLVQLLLSLLYCKVCSSQVKVKKYFPYFFNVLGKTYKVGNMYSPFGKYSKVQVAEKEQSL